MAEEYISRNEVLKKIAYVARTRGISEQTRRALTDRIKAIPAADVEPVKHSK